MYVLLDPLAKISLFLEKVLGGKVWEMNEGEKEQNMSGVGFAKI